ncbi:MAG: D-2-hydroxyacid dehydrogenase [Candidatus Dormibacteraceae bacterium]
MPERVPVLIASWFDASQAERIAAAEPDRVEVLYTPELLPVPRYEAEHHAPPRDLGAADRERWRRLAARAEVSLDFDWEAPERTLERSPRLRWIQASSSGVGPAVERYGLVGSQVAVTNAAGIHAQALAEFALLGALYFVRQVPMLRRLQVAHRWERYCGEELATRRMLVVGLGKVGRRVAEVAGALGMEVWGSRRTVGAERPAGVARVVAAAELDAALPETQVVVLTAPDNPSTRQLLDRRRLALLPREAVVVNIARGSLVEETALLDALRSGHLLGAALDVFQEEPLPLESPFWDEPNVLIAPHSASTVRQENDRLVDLFIENLHRYLDGRPLINQWVPD